MVDVFTKQESQELYEKLKSLVDPVPHKIVVWGKKYDEPRLKRFFTKKPLQYKSKYAQGQITTTSNEWPDVIQQLVAKAKELTGEDFNSALVNLYRNGDDCIGAHSDNDNNDGVGEIASFSFGATRDFIIKESATRNTVATVPLESGSLFVMRKGMQDKYLHSVPRKKVFNGRINVTLRQQIIKDTSDFNVN